MKYFTPEILGLENSLHKEVREKAPIAFRDAANAYNLELKKILASNSYRTRQVIRRLNIWHDVSITGISLQQLKPYRLVLELLVVDEEGVLWKLTLKGVHSFAANIPNMDDYFALSWGWCEFSTIMVNKKKLLKLSILCGNLETEIASTFSSVRLVSQGKFDG